jgi:hypothetical protein
VEEEEEESSCRRDRGANKEEHMDHPYVISSPLLLPIFGSPYKKKEKIPKKKSPKRYRFERHYSSSSPRHAAGEEEGF